MMDFSKLDCETLVREAVQNERRRIVGMVLAKFGEARSAGAESIAHALDELATEIEHGRAVESA